VVDLEAYIEEVSDGIYLIDPCVYDSRGYIAIYFVTKPKTLLFDVGPSSTADRVIAALESLGYGGENIDYVFVSHMHVEHSGGLARIASWASGAKIIASPASVRHMADPSKMYQAYASYFGKFSERIGDYPPMSKESIQRVVSTVSEIHLDDKRGLIFPCVGHAHHQICLNLDGYLFGADILCTQLRLGDYYIPMSTPPSFNYLKYTEDLDTALTLNPTKLMLSHYGAHSNPTEVITKALESIKWLRRQVESLLKEGLLAEEVADTLLKGLAHDPSIDSEYARIKARTNLLGFINGVIKIRSERV